MTTQQFLSEKKKQYPKDQIGTTAMSNNMSDPPAYVDFFVFHISESYDLAAHA